MRYTVGRMYNIWDELLFIAVCGSNPDTLLWPSGSFGISTNQYKNNMNCGWKIVVEADRVSNMFITYKLFHTIDIGIAV